MLEQRRVLLGRDPRAVGEDYDRPFLITLGQRLRILDLDLLKRLFHLYLAVIHRIGALRQIQLKGVFMMPLTLIRQRTIMHIVRCRIVY